MKYPFVWLSLLYSVIRLINLTGVPIFNDEAIYIDWGWRSFTSFPNHLFYSLYDAKQPLLLWLFGLSAKLFSDSLFAARLVSVCTGWLTLAGIYLVSKQLWNKMVGLWANLLYIFTPLFSFFDRQALMESAISAISIWALFLLLKITKQPSVWLALVLGLVLGLGYMVKSTAAVFILLSLTIIVGNGLNTKRFLLSFLCASVSLFGVTVVLIPLFSQEMYWKTLPTNTRYVLSITELLQFPINRWLTNLSAVGQIALVHLTPVVVGLAVLAVYHLKKQRLLLFWSGGGLLMQLLVMRSPLERYTVPFLVPIVVYAGWYLASLQKRYLQIVCLALPSVLTILQIVYPLGYFQFLRQFSVYHLGEYTNGITAGYGITEVVTFLKQEAIKGPIFVGIALNTGNPESAITAAFLKDPMVKVTYMTRQSLGPQADTAACLVTPLPLFFISRGSQLADLNPFLELVENVTSPVSKSTIGIWKLKTSCEGEKLYSKPSLTW